MQSDNNKINTVRMKHILKKYKSWFDVLEEYERTGQLPFQRVRIDVTLSISAINKLKEIRQKTGKPISRIIEEKLL